MALLAWNLFLCVLLSSAVKVLLLLSLIRAHSRGFAAKVLLFLFPVACGLLPVALC